MGLGGACSSPFPFQGVFMSEIDLLNLLNFGVGFLCACSVLRFLIK